MSIFESLTELEWLQMVWIVLNTVVLISPFLTITTEAGTYGKLYATADKANDKQKEGSSLYSLLFLPSWYITTSTAFISYYVLASAWNSILFLESANVFVTSSYSNAPVLTSLFRFFNHQQAPPASSLIASQPADARFQVSILLVQTGLFQIHLLRRLYESLFITNFSPNSKQHALVTLLAYVYYFLVVLTPFVDSPLINPTVSSGYSSLLSPCSHKMLIYFSVALFAFGWYGQHVSHCTLASLRLKKSAEKPYAIPFGGLFSLVSMPHYLCEMIEYTAMWMLSGFKFSQLSVPKFCHGERICSDRIMLNHKKCEPRNEDSLMSLFTLIYWLLLLSFCCRLVCVWVYSNLCITGVRSHKWYQKQFPDYPPARRAVIPCIL